MDNGYNIGIKHEDYKIKVYLEPQCSHAEHKRYLGYICKDDNTFHCMNPDLMNIEVMGALVYHWANYNLKSKTRELENE